MNKSKTVIYNALKKIGPTTASVIAKHLNYRVKGSVCARLAELFQDGKVLIDGKVVCPISKIKVFSWRVKK